MTIKAGFCKPAQLSMRIQTFCAATDERAESARPVFVDGTSIGFVGYRPVTTIIQGYGDGALSQIFIKYKVALIFVGTVILLNP